ncbi:hypothetical protein [Phenylobacterium sp.]|uniref:hypothetical protein n=1 Tax=Phenylobacterium sp. TaxID=1871053 RepID=UPI0035B0066F
MRLAHLAVDLAIAVAGPALAQGGFNPGRKPGGYGTFSPGGPRTAPKADFGLPRPPAPPTSAAKAPTTAPSSPAFKPHEPWKSDAPTSLFGPDGKPKKK